MGKIGNWLREKVNKGRIAIEPPTKSSDVLDGIVELSIQLAQGKICTLPFGNKNSLGNISNSQLRNWLYVANKEEQLRGIKILTETGLPKALDFLIKLREFNYLVNYDSSEGGDHDSRWEDSSPGQVIIRPAHISGPLLQDLSREIKNFYDKQKALSEISIFFEDLKKGSVYQMISSAIRQVNSSIDTTPYLIGGYSVPEGGRHYF